MKNYLLLTSILIMFTSCGVRFSQITHNKNIPDDLKNRTFWEETDIFKYNLEQLTGSIIYTFDEGENFKRGSRVVDSNNPPQIETIDKGLLYHSKINRDIQGNISVLAFAAELNTNQMVDIKVIDIIQSFIDFENIPIQKIKDIINSDELKNTKKYYIQGALLTSITKNYATKIDANASGVVGGAYGADGKVYNEETDFIQDYRISLALIDLNKLDVLLKASPLVEDNDELINILKSTMSSVSINSIEGF